MRVVRSLLDPADLGRLVEQEYEVECRVSVQLLRQGFNDTYLVTDPTGGCRVLRVYARDKYWIRSKSDLLYELELLDFLAARGRAVSGPYRRRSGDLTGPLEAPEGTRAFALFTHADGVPAEQLDPSSTRMRDLGVEIGRIHLAMEEFQTDHDRYHLDLDLLISMPLTAIAAATGTSQQAEYAELRHLAERLEEHIGGLDLPPGAYGPIHADLNPSNIHVRDDGGFAVFDFDHCGFGWRAYDLIALYPAPDAPEPEWDGWSQLLAGYQSVRPLSQTERDAMPAFAGCHELWNAGDWVRAASWAGRRWEPDRLCTRTLDRIRRRASIETRTGGSSKGGD